MEPHLFFRKKNWKATSQLCQLFTSSLGVRYDFGVSDHQGPPKKPPGQKNTGVKGREHILMIVGKLLSYACLF